jgi:hypothetical protein
MPDYWAVESTLACTNSDSSVLENIFLKGNTMLYKLLTFRKANRVDPFCWWQPALYVIGDEEEKGGGPDYSG